MTSRAISSERPATTTTSSPRPVSTAEQILHEPQRLLDRLQRRRAAVDEAALQPVDGARFGRVYRLDAERQRRERLPRRQRVDRPGRAPRTSSPPTGASCADGAQVFQQSSGSGSKSRRLPELEVAVQHQRPVPASAELQHRGEPVRPPGISRSRTTRRSAAATWARLSDRATSSSATATTTV